MEVLLNGLLENPERLPYSFYIQDLELGTDLGTHLAQTKQSVEQCLNIVYQPQV